MSAVFSKSTALAAALLASSALSQTNFPEVEPNSQKTQATPVNGIIAGDTITGVTTGLVTTLGDTSLPSADVFRVKTAAQPLGIYRHALSLVSTPTGQSGSIRGLNQVGGVIGATDVAVQTSSTATVPASTNAWYGFGKQEEIYYRVTGTAATTGAYTATLSTATITPTVIAGTFNPGLISVAAAVSQTTDAEIFVYDSNLNPVPMGHNDNPISGPAGVNCLVTVTLVPGTYYVAISNYNTANNQSDAHPNEVYLNENVLDFPDAIANNSTSLTAPVSYTVTDGGTTTPITATHGSIYDIQWGTFTVQVNTNPPVNDNCAAAQAIGSGTFSGILTYATNDGTASCDPGGAASRDVWYAFTDTAGNGGTLKLDTCTTASDTVLSVHASCGGSQLACSDDCAGTPCGGTTSCVSQILAPGQSVLIRVSDKGLGAGLYVLHSSFTANLAVLDTQINPANGHTYKLLQFGSWSAAEATAVVLGGHLATVNDAAENAWITTTWQNFQATPHDLWIGFNDAAVEGTFVWADGSPVGYTNWDPGEPNNAGAGEDYTNIRRDSATGNWNDLPNSPSGFFNMVYGVVELGGTLTTSFCLGDGTGTACPCANTGTAGNGCANASFPAGANLAASGTAGASPGTDTLVLTATNVPGPALFIQSNGVLPAPANFGDGHLCAAIGIIRLGIVFPSVGSASYPGGLTPNPIHIQGLANNGDTKHYQAWYRSLPALCGAGNYDLSQGISLVWGP